MTCLSCSKRLVLKGEENAWFCCEICNYPLVCDRCNHYFRGANPPSGNLIDLIVDHKVKEHFTSVELV